LIALLGACAAPSSDATPSPSATPNVALSKAADLRTHLDLLFAEHVTIVAKESAAAINHADEYAAYAALLHANAADLSTLLSRALGATTAAQLSDLWEEQNTLLVDYAIGAASHDDAKSKQAAAALTSTFVPAYAQLLASASGAQQAATAALVAQQAGLDRALIDDYAAQRFANFYADLGRTSAHSLLLGDELAAGVVRMYGDKFPGDPAAASVDARVRLNVLLQEDAYLSTMATDAKVAGRTADAAAAQAALTASAAALRSAVALARGDDTATRFANLWSTRNVAMSRYAAGDHSAGTAVSATFAVQLGTLIHTPSSLATDQATAMLKVVDDQLAKGTAGVAGDDRASATAMQPIAVAIVS
jgi:hypothetical protein